MNGTLTKKMADVKPGTLFVGVDMGLDANVAVVLNAQAQRLARFRFPNDADGYAYFRRRLKQLQERHQAAAVRVAMESTNYFWKLLATDLEAHGIAYRLVNAYTVKKRREGDQLDRSKDDARDAFTIADVLHSGRCMKTQLFHDGYAELRQYVILYDRLGRDIRRQKNFIHNIAGQLFPEFSSVFKDFSGQTAVAMLRQHAAAVCVRQMPFEEFIAAIRADFGGSRLMMSKLRQVHKLAARSVGLQHGVEALQLALRLHIETLEALQKQQEQVQTALLDTFNTLPESRYLLSLPKLGAVSAAIILAEMGDPRRYRNASQLVKLAGLQPVPNTSGRRSRSRTPISRKGRPRLRTTLYFAVMRLVQSDDAFAGAYQRFLQRPKNPLTRMQALGALMNRLLRILWTLMRYQRLYDPHYQPGA
jgi:transposase